MNRPRFSSREWIRSKNDPKNDMIHGDRLFYFETGGGYGTTDGAGQTWYRLNCSYWFGDWIEANGIKNEQWLPYGAPNRAIYIVREDLMSFIKLKWL